MVYINVKCTTISTWGRTKIFFCCSRVVLTWGLFLGIFWPEEGRRPSEGQKNPKNRPKAKTSLAKAKSIFLSFQMVINEVHWTLITIFFTYRTRFPVEKVSLVVTKNSYRIKKILCCFSRNEKNRARTESLPIRKKCTLGHCVLTLNIINSTRSEENCMLILHSASTQIFH